jgi:carbon storage regulator
VLVLTRRVDEQIVIGDPPVAVITVISIKGDRIRIGIQSDRDIPIMRAELLEKQTCSRPSSSPPSQP